MERQERRAVIAPRFGAVGQALVADVDHSVATDVLHDDGAKMRGDQRIGYPALFVVEPLHWPARQNGETSAVIEIVMRLGQKRRGPGQRVERAVAATESQSGRAHV